ncbi:MAG: hypothetical protein WDO13_20110 [Verrucomicrobiota bacterium]
MSSLVDQAGREPLRAGAAAQHLRHRAGGRGQDHLHRQPHRVSRTAAGGRGHRPPVAAHRGDLLGARGPADAAKGARRHPRGPRAGPRAARVPADLLRHDPQLLRAAARPLRPLISACRRRSGCWRTPTNAGSASWCAACRRDVARDPHLRDLFAFYAPEKLYRLGREIAPDEVREPGPPPAVDIAPVLAFQDMAPAPQDAADHRRRAERAGRVERGLGPRRAQPAAEAAGLRGGGGLPRAGGTRPSRRCTTGSAPRRSASAAAWPMPTGPSGCARR